MAIQQTPQADLFKLQLRESLQRETANTRAVKVARHTNVYTCGDRDEMVYFVESGQVKLLMLSTEGKECLLAIHSGGDIFGELCLSGIRRALGNRDSDESDDVKTNSHARSSLAVSTATRCLKVSCATSLCGSPTSSKSSPIS